MAEFDIREAELSDADTLMAFNSAMALETENKVLEPAVLGAGVQKLLQHPELGFYLIARCDGEPVGSLMVTGEWSDWRNGLFWWIQSVYVTPDYRRQGVYRQLYRHVQKEARQRQDICGFRLYVEKNNLRAQQTYQSLGMSETIYQLYEEAVITRPPDGK